jgi:hypothetical protein
MRFHWPPDPNRLTKTLAVLACVVGLSHVAVGQQFLTAVEYPTGSAAFDVVVGDFNHDGIPDLAVTNGSFGEPVGTISILIGKGNGSFEPAVNYTSGGSEPTGIAMGDLNGDGSLDLVVANNAGGGGAGSIAILLGKGDGSFSAPVLYTAGTRPLGVAVADFNGDGKLDIAATNEGGSNVSIFLGKGDGSFSAPVNYVVGLAPFRVMAADFNRDGKIDLAVANQNDNTLSILLGKGDGTFNSAVNYNAGASPDSIASGDLNGDGNLDLVVSDAGSASGTTVGVLLGNGDGTFKPLVSYAAGNEPTSVVLGDFNIDGKLDIVSTDFSSGAIGGAGEGTAISLLLGNGDGTFQSPVQYSVGIGPVNVVAADLNGDGSLDLVTANEDSNDVSVLLNVSQSCAMPPVITDVSADPGRLWPPDHRLADVQIKYRAQSSCGSVSCKLSVSSNEPDRDDWFILDPHHVLLRADEGRDRSREDHEKTRIYQISIDCSDSSGTSAEAHTSVQVAPRDHEQ